MIQPDQTSEPGRGVVAALGKVEPGHATADFLSEVARRAAETAAYVEHMVGAQDAGFAEQQVIGGQPTEVILIVLTESLLRQRRQRGAAGFQRVKYLRLVDCVLIRLSHPPTRL